MVNWTYQKKVITSIDQVPEGAVGFTYIISLVDGRWYIGRKGLTSTVTRPALKGTKRKRKIIKQSDWLTYKSSNKAIKDLDDFEINSRTIIEFAYTRKHLTYLECHALFTLNVLSNPLSINGNIQGRFFPIDIPGNKKI